MKIYLDKGAFCPTRAHKADAGLDIYSPLDTVVPAHGSCVINSGVHVGIPFGWVGMIKSKSGLNVNCDILSEGVIDSGYTGAIRVKLYNHGNKSLHIKRGDKITQLVVVPCMTEEVELVETLQETERGERGFGSSGR